MTHQIVMIATGNFCVFLSGRIDTFIGSETAIRYQLAKKNLTNDFRKAELSFKGGEYHLAMSKKSPNLESIEPLTKELAIMKNEWEIVHLTNQSTQDTSGKLQ